MTIALWGLTGVIGAIIGFFRVREIWREYQRRKGPTIYPPCTIGGWWAYFEKGAEWWAEQEIARHERKYGRRGGRVAEKEGVA